MTDIPTDGASRPKAARPSAPLLDRDHSTLAFNERVLDWACRNEVPLLERLRYLRIVSSNLDEFFEKCRPAVRSICQTSCYSNADVLAIRQTIYRTGADSALMDLLREAVRRGKEVMVIVELKARFDEEANINWAETLEAIGAQVVYGVVGLKTHAKMLLVTRREGRHLRCYGHLSTGNYNLRTARLYTDLSHLTADADLTSDMAQVFVHLAGQSRLPRLAKLWLAPFHLHRRLLQKIAAVGDAAAAGLPGRIVAKMNALTDEALVTAFIEAGRKGARIDLIVRGACVLPAGVPGFTDNIRVRSVIGRFLEHTRLFYFRNGEDEQLYLSSADWMNRNMMRRVELAWPVTDRVLRQRIVDECLVAYLHDEVDAWDILPDGSYVRVAERAGPVGHGAQAALAERYGGGGERRGARDEPDLVEACRGPEIA